ncbi:MAG: hypothetical protein H0X64_06655 [Gemmatimonadaceae bacterium]|nr:hypothetical protein [Gemmatimonadaceae bacterium]
MKIEAVWARSVRLSNTTLMTSYGSNAVERDHLFVAVATEDGTVGYGEGSPLPHFSGERAPEMQRVAAEVFAPALLGRDALDMEGAQQALRRALPHHGATKAALVSALFDLQGKRAGLPAHVLLGGAVATQVSVAGALGIEPIEVALQRVAELRAAGHRTVKMKVGADVDRDVRLVHAIREEHGFDVRIRADANGGYSVAQARRFAREVAEARLEYFEQPLAAHDIEGLVQLRASGLVPIAVDESLFSLQDAFDIARRGAADVFVIKLIKLGGLHVARKVVAIAEAAGIRCTAVSPYETALGVSANLHLVASSDVFAHDSELGVGVSSVAVPGVRELSFQGGRLVVPAAPGLGVEMPEGFFAPVAA